MSAPTVAALFVESRGLYAHREGVDPWDKERDARRYPGPLPVVAHPPCERWGRYWQGGPSATTKLVLGDDGGCFAAALAAARKWGGVLEHPAGSHAWSAFGLKAPARWGSWTAADFAGGWTCCVDQGHYGHRAAKATWLYACGVKLPSLKWGPSGIVIAPTAREEALGRRSGVIERMSSRQRQATPEPFAALLIEIARTARAG